MPDPFLSKNLLLPFALTSLRTYWRMMVNSVSSLDLEPSEVSDNPNSPHTPISPPAVPPAASPRPMSSPPSSQNDRRQSQALFDRGNVRSTLFAIQCSWIIGLVPVCLTNEPPAAWLRRLLIAIIFLMIVGLLLTLYWRCLALDQEMSGSRINYLPVVSILITTLAILITAAACLCYLLGST